MVQGENDTFKLVNLLSTLNKKDYEDILELLLQKNIDFDINISENNKILAENNDLRNLLTTNNLNLSKLKVNNEANNKKMIENRSKLQEQIKENENLKNMFETKNEKLKEKVWYLKKKIDEKDLIINCKNEEIDILSYSKKQYMDFNAEKVSHIGKLKHDIIKLNKSISLKDTNFKILTKNHRLLQTELDNFKIKYEVLLSESKNKENTYNELNLALLQENISNIKKN